MDFEKEYYAVKNKLAIANADVKDLWKAIDEIYKQLHEAMADRVTSGVVDSASVSQAAAAGWAVYQQLTEFIEAYHPKNNSCTDKQDPGTNNTPISAHVKNTLNSVLEAFKEQLDLDTVADDVTASYGPVSTLPGSISKPRGQMCGAHPEIPAVVRVQRETDSFGCEYVFMCQSCYDEYKKYLDSPENMDTCPGCGKEARLHPHRDPEEGAAGPVYYHCRPCITEQARNDNSDFDRD